MPFIPADLYFTDYYKYHIADTLLYSANIDSNNYQPAGTGDWITDNLYAINIPSWGAWWFFAHFYNNNTVKTGFTPFTNIPSEQELLNALVNRPSGTWTGNLQSNLNLQSNTIPISNICFPAGTPISCNQGNIPIEKINPDIHTIRNKKIVEITKTITQDKYLVCFEKDALGSNVPSQKTIMSKNHSIFYQGYMTQAKQFVGINDKVYKINYRKEVLYNVLMEEHDKMVVNNLICETLHPENRIAKLYRYLQKLNPEQQNDLIIRWNGNGFLGRPRTGHLRYIQWTLGTVLEKATNDLYITEHDGRKVRKVGGSSHALSTIAGTGTGSFVKRQWLGKIKNHTEVVMS